MSFEACCTCASLLSPLRYYEPTDYKRRLECCNRLICARCLKKHPRFSTYCPFCQVSIVPSSLPQGLRDPPEYSPPAQGTQTTRDEEPPPYSAHNTAEKLSEKSSKTEDQAQDVLHFVDPNKDSIASLSLSYGVPVDVLKRTNGLFADHLRPVPGSRRHQAAGLFLYPFKASRNYKPLFNSNRKLSEGQLVSTILVQMYEGNLSLKAHAASYAHASITISSSLSFSV